MCLYVGCEFCVCVCVCVWKRSVLPWGEYWYSLVENVVNMVRLSLLVESAVILLALGNGIFVDVIGPSTVGQVKPFERVLNSKVAICNPCCNTCRSYALS
jgi:hypothetical protein